MSLLYTKSTHLYNIDKKTMNTNITVMRSYSFTEVLPRILPGILPRTYAGGREMSQGHVSVFDTTVL